MIGQCKKCGNEVGFLNLKNKLCASCFNKETQHAINNHAKAKSLLNRLFIVSVIFVIASAFLLWAISEVMPRGC